MALSTLQGNAAGGRAAAARARYVTDTIETVSPSRLVTMLYDALVKDLVLAEDTLNESRDLRVVNDRLVHAQQIITELQSGLDTTKWEGGPALDRLYTFLHGELVKANVEKNAMRIASCRLLVEPLRQAWHEAADAMAKGA
jgi:flagellar protein FliS